MAYIHGDAYPSVEKQSGGAALAKAHLAELRQAVDGLGAHERAGFMSEFIGGVIELSESMAAQDGRGGSAAVITKSAGAAGKERVASKKSRCGTCNKKLKASWAACPRCAKPNLRRSQKATRAMLTKSATPWNGGGSWCVRGHWTAAPRGRCCAACGDLMETSLVPPLAAVKSSAFADNYWRRQLGSSPDPGQRMLYEQARWGTGQNGGRSS